ncbi:MAG: ABC transporter permease [Erysipelothrix sp.]|nr:ABC transporter permease [Erysipelothrix sp.]
MINRFFRHIKEGFINIFRNLAMSISSISAVTITLILVGVFIVISTNITSISDSIKSSLNIVVKIDLDITDDDIAILQEKVSTIKNVSDVEFSSKHDELEKQINLYPQQAEYYRRHQGKNNPLHNIFIVEVTDASHLSAINEQISSLNGVHTAEQGGDGVETLVNALNSMQKTGWIIVVILTLLAMYLISNTIKSSIYSQREEIGIMRNVGASNRFIRAPYLVGGIIIGILGSIIPITLAYFGYSYLYKATGGMLLSKMFVIQPIFPFVIYLSAILLAIGVGVGLVGSFISVTRFLRWKR